MCNNMAAAITLLHIRGWSFKVHAQIALRFLSSTQRLLPVILWHTCIQCSMHGAAAVKTQSAAPVDSALSELGAVEAAAPHEAVEHNAQHVLALQVARQSVKHLLKCSGSSSSSSGGGGRAGNMIAEWILADLVWPYGPALSCSPERQAPDEQIIAAAAFGTRMLSAK
jgi:hypothetical protein